MVYLLSVGLNLEMGQKILGDLRAKEPDFTNTDFKKRFMVVTSDGTVNLLPYEREEACCAADHYVIAFLVQGLPVIPLWLDRIYLKLVNELK